MLSLPSLEIYPSKRKVFRDRQEIQLTAKEYEILLLLAANKGHVLTYSQIYEKVWGDIPSGCESNTIGFHICTCGRSCTRQLPMLPLPSDPSGKSDTVLKYKQKNKSQQSDPLRLLFFFFCCKSLLQWEVHLLLSSCQVPPFTKRAQLPLGGRWYFYMDTVYGSEKAGCSCRPWHGTFAQ